MTLALTLTERLARARGDLRMGVPVVLTAEGAGALAVSLICLIDGICLQQCMDPEVIGAEAAKRACRAFLAPHLD